MSGGQQQGRLLQLREWLTVPDAARSLSLSVREPVTDSDILRLGLDRQLTLSVRFVNEAIALRYREQTQAELEQFGKDLESRMDAIRTATTAGVVSIPQEHRTSWQKRAAAGIVVLGPDAVFDLPMVGGEKKEVEHRYQRSIGGPDVTRASVDGIFVESGDGTRYVLQEDLPATTFQTAHGPFEIPACLFPP
jgi:hypothetical protein